MVAGAGDNMNILIAIILITLIYFCIWYIVVKRKDKDD
jgi:hypothetical protein